MDECKNKDMRIDRLVKENKSLTDEYSKDEEIQKMNQQLDNMREDLRRGFPITEIENERIKTWKNEHEEKVHGITKSSKKMRYGGTIGGSYTYKFTPTSIGVFGTVECSCGERFDFSEL
jgi:hypothetical protein